MSLDVHLKKMQLTDVHWQNITHNLNKMAEEAGRCRFMVLTSREAGGQFGRAHYQARRR